MTVDLQTLASDLISHEGLLLSGYRDTTAAGFFTVGIGHMCPTADACAQLPWLRSDGRQATPAEARACYAAVMAMPAGLVAGHYASASPLRLTEDVARELCMTRLEREFLPGLQRLFTGFDGYPASAVRALVDMIYNMGEGHGPRPGVDAKGLFAFANLRAACARGAWARAAVESHRSTCRPERNEWARQMFLSAAGA